MRRNWRLGLRRSGRGWNAGDAAAGIAALRPYFEANENAPARIRAGVVRIGDGLVDAFVAEAGQVAEKIPGRANR
ncbi:hypothetical protein GCM10009744_42510 [Kribbella alba]|uniref:Uncharacterized protein n=1 Tax=Kribbella alba TaxID=190197 RepID=A0ABN2FH75_9ACTN